MSEIVIYKTDDNETQVEVKFENDTVWLTQEQMVLLFQRDQSVISRHIRNTFSEGELDEKRNMQKMHIPNSDKPASFYSLDVIISVGYRVKSKRGTQFRQWATQRLKDHLVKGYTINQKRLDQLNHAIQLIGNGGRTENLSLVEAKGLLEIISGYSQSFVLLNRFDSHRLSIERLNENITYEIQYEEQAAHLLYFIIKNHPFSDGNKRIGAFLFIWFLEKNKHRFKKSGEPKINDNALVALALLVAQSNPSDKEIMIKLVINLINTQ